MGKSLNLNIIKLKLKERNLFYQISYKFIKSSL